MKHTSPIDSDVIHGNPHGLRQRSGRRLKATLLGLAMALAIPSALGCSDGGVRWARAHAVQDGAVAASHAVARVVASLDKPATAAPTAAGTKVAASKTGESRSGATEVSRPAAKPEADLNAALGVKRLVVAHGVKGREPVSPDGRVFDGCEADLCLRRGEQSGAGGVGGCSSASCGKGSASAVRCGCGWASRRVGALGPSLVGPTSPGVMWRWCARRTGQAARQGAV